MWYLFIFALLTLVGACQSVPGNVSSTLADSTNSNTGSKPPLESPNQTTEDNQEQLRINNGSHNMGIPLGSGLSSSLTTTLGSDFGIVRNLYPGVQLDSNAPGVSPYDNNPLLSGTQMVLSFYVTRLDLETYLRGNNNSTPPSGNPADNVLANGVDIFHIFATGPYDTYDNKINGADRSHTIVPCQESAAVDTSLRIPSSGYLYQSTGIAGTTDITLPRANRLYTGFQSGKYYWFNFCLSSPVDPTNAAGARNWYGKAVQIRSVDYTPPVEGAFTAAAASCLINGSSRQITRHVQLNSVDPSLSTLQVLYIYSSSVPNDWSSAGQATLLNLTDTLASLQNGSDTSVVFQVADNGIPAQYKIIYADNSQDFDYVLSIAPNSQAIFSSGPVTNLLGFQPSLQTQPLHTILTGTQSSCP